jgi:hypothetical protein
VLDNPHDALRISVLDEAGVRSNRMLALAGAARITQMPAGTPMPDGTSPPGASPPAGASPPGASPPAKVSAAAPPVVRLTPGTRVATLEIEFANPPISPPTFGLPGSTAMIVDALDLRRFITHIDARGQTPLKVQALTVDGGVVEAAVDLPWTAVPRSAEGKHEALSGKVLIQFSAGAFFEDAYVWAEEASGTSSSALPAGLVPVGPFVRVEPAGLPLDRGLWVGIRLDTTAASAARVGLFRVDSAGKLSFEGAERADLSSENPPARSIGIPTKSASTMSFPTIGTRVRRLGRFVLARDDAPPTLQFLSPAAGAVLTSGRPLLRARVRDRQSGFREDDVTFLIDGRRVPTEWNPEADSIQHRPRFPLARGKHVIVAEATDRAGLTTRREITVTVR